MDSLDISSKSIIKLILQFLIENGLHETYSVLEKESGIILNGVENIEHIRNLVISGLWADLMILLRYIKLPVNLLIILFEHIFLELLEMKEPEVAKFLLENSDPLKIYLKRRNTKKHQVFVEVVENSKRIISASLSNDKLESKYKIITDFVDSNYLESGDKLKSRERLFILISEHLEEIQPSKLLEIIGLVLRNEIKNKVNKFINHNMNTRTFNIFDIGKQKMSKTNRPKNHILINENKFPSKICNSFNSKVYRINYNKFGHIKCITFSPNEQQLVIGTSKGYIFFGDWNEDIFNISDEKPTRFYTHCNEEVNILALRTISMENNRLVHSEIIDNSNDDNNYLIASTSEKIDIKIWNCLTSGFILIINNLHEKYITDFVFNKDRTCILSGSYDGVMKIHGLKSQRTIKYFPNSNNYFIRKVSYNSTETMVLSGLNNGTINIWDIKTSKCIAMYSICNSPILNLDLTNNSQLIFTFQKDEFSLNKIQTFDKFLVGTKKNIYILDISNGEKNKMISDKKEHTENIISICFDSKKANAFLLEQNSQVIMINLLNNKVSSKLMKNNPNLEYEVIIASASMEALVLQTKDSVIIIDI